MWYGSGVAVGSCSSIRLVVMTSRTAGDVAAQARTYFSDKVGEAKTLLSPKSAYVAWRERAIRAFIGEGYSAQTFENADCPHVPHTSANPEN